MANLEKQRETQAPAGALKPAGYATALQSEWDSLREVALLAYPRTGSHIWLHLSEALSVAASTAYRIVVAAIPGSHWGTEFEHFAVELVRLDVGNNSIDSGPTNRARARVFRYDQPVTRKTLGEIRLSDPDRPFIEGLMLDGPISIDVRGLHLISPEQWSEEILLLLKGAWLITRNSELLTAREAGYEVQISGAIEAMARRGQERTTPPRFTKTAFKEFLPIKMSRSNLYNIIPDDRWPEIERRYYKRWSELHAKP